MAFCVCSADEQPVSYHTLPVLLSNAILEDVSVGFQQTGYCDGLKYTQFLGIRPQQGFLIGGVPGRGVIQSTETERDCGAARSKKIHSRNRSDAGPVAPCGVWHMDMEPVLYLIFWWNTRR
jgi:hypothetical protein